MLARAAPLSKMPDILGTMTRTGHEEGYVAGILRLGKQGVRRDPIHPAMCDMSVGSTQDDRRAG